ncbi:GNAT family N-acetyltransferase [Eleftheria terrae]|uniref:GNAT family N-acetyltransferase n=1 Tax=Eleftheria terrae TaxID=1597781 RepID=UPI00263AF033|nr:GNAT family N-acetyltransferase [Eleftheria terrae]WKB55290.1 GNAT family N-acetyltransferase [Eleftheria terrae]
MAATGDELTVEVAGTVSAFPPGEWDGLLAPTDYFRHAYLASLEHSGLDCRFDYAVLRRGAALVGLGFGCLLRFNFGCLHPKVWMSGTPVNLGLPFAFQAGCDTPQARGLLQQALFERACHAGALYFVLRDFPAPQAAGPTAIAAPALKLLPMPLHCTAILPLTFPDFDAYLGSLGGSGRKSVKRDLRRVQEAGFRWRAERPSPELAPRLLELWLPLYRKYRDPDQIRLTEGYFRALIASPDAVFLLLWRAGELVAFDLCLRHGDLLSSIFSGIAPGIGRLPIHRYMGYAIVQHAMALQCHAIDFGISNEEAKARMGCRLRMLYGYGRPVSPALHFLGVGKLVKVVFSAPAAKVEAEAQPCPGRPMPAASSGPAHLQGWRRAIVIGAGLGGLAAAARLASAPRVEVTVLERAADIGGMCRMVAFGAAGPQFVAGCNLFSPGFFALLARYYGIRLPTRRARILTFHAGVPLSLRRLAGRGLSVAELAAVWRVAQAALLKPGSSMAQAAMPIGAPTALAADLALLPFLLQGQDADQWPVRAGLAKLRHADACLYPTPGLAAVPQSLRRFMERHGQGRVQLGAAATAIEVQAGQVVGVRTQQGNWPADIVISSLDAEATLQLMAGCPHPVPQRVAGLSAMAVFLLLDAAFPLPTGYHSLAFIAPGVLDQLHQLFNGRVPPQPSFELVCPDLSQGRAPDGGWPVTIFSTCPAGEDSGTEAAQLLWQRIGHCLEQTLPGFGAAIRWSKVVAPAEYLRDVGCLSRLSPYAERGCEPQPGPPMPLGLSLSHSASGPPVADTLAALRGGLDAAHRVLAGRD